MLLTAYSGDDRVPLAGVLRYTEQMKKSIRTHFTVNPESGMLTPTLSHMLQQKSLVDNVDVFLDLLHIL